MRKKLAEEYLTKAKKREIKKRPRMQMRGRGLRSSRHGGGLVASIKPARRAGG